MSITIALVGRSNVGKSTLFNKLIGKKLAIVDNIAGVTRDRHIHAARLQDLFFDLIDTAGLDDKKNHLPGRIWQQTLVAINESDLILFIFDAKEGITTSDLACSEIVRKSGKAVVLVANKLDSTQTVISNYEAWQLGLGEACSISAEHGTGFSELRDAIFNTCYSVGLSNKLEKKPEQVIQNECGSKYLFYPKQEILHVAILGRPNTGKSTLLNALLGKERFLTGPEAGLTRDSIFVDMLWCKQKIRFYDTAGLRRKARVQEKLEKLSVAATMRTARFSEIVVIVLDATSPFEKQDLQIADFIIREGRAPIIALNKWDLIKNKQQVFDSLHEQCKYLLPQIRNAFTIPISGKTKQGLDELLRKIKHVNYMWNLRLSTGKLNRWLEDVIVHHPPPAVSGRRLKVKYLTQIKTRPPRFVISCSRPDFMPQSYLRYLIGRLSCNFGLIGVPIRISIAKTKNPFGQKTTDQ